MEIEIDSEITLKQISLAYAEELFNLVNLNLDKNLGYWCPDLAKTYSSFESTMSHINDASSKFNDDKTPDLLILYKGKLTGLISLSPIYDQKSEIGYWLGAEFENLGLVSRSIPNVLNYAKTSLKLKSIDLSTSAPNTQSQKLPIRFNFQKMRIVKDAEKIGDKLVDHILWNFTL